MNDPRLHYSLLVKYINQLKAEGYRGFDSLLNDKPKQNYDYLLSGNKQDTLS